MNGAEQINVLKQNIEECQQDPVAASRYSLLVYTTEIRSISIASLYRGDIASLYRGGHVILQFKILIFFFQINECNTFQF